MVLLKNVPQLPSAALMLADAEKLNPGPWAQHSRFVSQAAGLIAARHSELDVSTAQSLGLLHDIGRREGVTDMRHVLDGYRFLHNQGYLDAARICLTHSFPIKKVEAASGEWDCTSDELAFIRSYLDKIEFDLYDRLIQLCDAIALPAGFCLMEKRLVDVALRRGVNALTVEKWKMFLTIQKEFEQAIGVSIYTILPGVVQNTFQINLG